MSATPAPVAHTPGPLEIVRYGDGDSLVLHSAGSDWRVCFMSTPGSSPSAMDRIKRNARLLAAAYTSYDKHCADPIAAAEGDLLGEALKALAKCAEAPFSGWTIAQAIARDVLSRAGKLKGADHG